MFGFLSERPCLCLSKFLVNLPNSRNLLGVSYDVFWETGRVSQSYPWLPGPVLVLWNGSLCMLGCVLDPLDNLPKTHAICFMHCQGPVRADPGWLLCYAVDPGWLPCYAVTFPHLLLKFGALSSIWILVFVWVRCVESCLSQSVSVTFLPFSGYSGSSFGSSCGWSIFANSFEKFASSCSGSWPSAPSCRSVSCLRLRTWSVVGPLSSLCLRTRNQSILSRCGFCGLDLGWKSLVPLCGPFEIPWLGPLPNPLCHLPSSGSGVGLDSGLSCRDFDSFSETCGLVVSFPL